MSKKVKKFFGALRIVAAQTAYQPNSDSTVALILTAEELPGSGWKTSLRQAFPTGAFNREDPIRIRAKEIGSTTVRHEFQLLSSSRALLIAVTPLASASDSESWVANADERVARSVSKFEDIREVRVIDDLSLANVGSAKGFTYTFSRPKGLRIAVAAASN
jgi:hypothetical protein